MAFCYPEKYTSDAAGVDGVREQAQRRLEEGFAVLEAALEPSP
jgi:hypothetical protein